MKRALIIGASGAIGSALCAALRDRGLRVTGLSRSEHGLDVTDEASVEAALGALAPGFDLIIIATGALEIDGKGPEKAFQQIDAGAMARQYALNAIGPALVIKHATRLLPRDRPAVIAALSARVGSIGDNALGGWMGYRAAKAGLNQILRCAAIELGRSHPQTICVALHPGTVESALTRRYLGRYPAVAPSVSALSLLSVIGSLTADDTGKVYDQNGNVVPW